MDYSAETLPDYTYSLICFLLCFIVFIIALCYAIFEEKRVSGVTKSRRIDKVNLI